MIKLVRVKNVKPGAPVTASVSGVKRAGPDCFPIKDCCSRTEKKTPKTASAYLVFLCNSVSGKQCIWRLKVELKAYLSPKAKHKNMLIFSEAGPTAAITDRLSLQTDYKQRAKHLQGIVWDTPQRTTCVLIHSPHLISCHLSTLFTKLEKIVFWRFFFFLLGYHSFHFFLIHTVSVLVLS